MINDMYHVQSQNQDRDSQADGRSPLEFREPAWKISIIVFVDSIMNVRPSTMGQSEIRPQKALAIL
jgi:hypothetical protein